MPKHSVALQKTEKNPSNMRRFLGSKHLFPIICLAILLLLTVFRISGSSVGFYNEAFYGPNHKDTNLIFGHPRGVRSDEFLYVTPSTVGQNKVNYPLVNPNVGNDQNMSVIVDAPYREWSTLFRPQNIAFLVLPLEYAFAFKWWLLGFLLVISCYYFCLELLPGKRLWATFISLALFFSPFIQWWYQSITLGSVFYYFFIALTGMAILKATSWRKRLLLGGVLSHLVAAFALLMYPPFQIPAAMAAVAFLVGYALTHYHTLPRKQLVRSISALVGSIVVGCLVVLLFLKTRLDVISALNNTIYPGKRIVPSGGFKLQTFLSNPLSFQLQSTAKAAHYMNNQSEDSNFIALSPFLLISSIVVIVRQWRAKQRIGWPLIFVNALLLLFLCRLFVPHFNFLYKILHLSSIPQDRLLLGIGILGFLQLILYIAYHDRNRTDKHIRLLIGLLAFATTFAACLWTRHVYPDFVSHRSVIAAVSMGIAIIIYLVQGSKRQISIGLGLFALFCIGSSFYVNPLYRGLGPLTNSTLVQSIEHIGKPTDTWAAADSRLLVSIPLAAGKHTVTGIYTYPQKNIWTAIDNSPEASATYNRFAHVLLAMQPPASTASKANLNLVAEDYFTIQANPCTASLGTLHVKYVLSADPFAPSTCARLVKTITYPASTFYIYELSSAG